MRREATCRVAASHGAPAPGKRACEACLTRARGRVAAQYARNADAGLCRRAKAHGDAVRGGLCQACYDRDQAAAVARRRARGAEGICVNSARHGAAWPGLVVCGPCAAAARARMAKVKAP